MGRRSPPGAAFYHWEIPDGLNGEGPDGNHTGMGGSDGW